MNILRIKRIGALILILAALLACEVLPPLPPPPPPPQNSIIRGAVLLPTTSSTGAVAETPLPHGQVEQVEIARGRFFVMLSEVIAEPDDVVSVLEIGGMRPSIQVENQGEATYLADFGEMSVEETRRLATELADLPRVRFVEPVRILRPLFTPNDPQFPNQWSLREIRMSQAWSLIPGSVGDVTEGRIAIIDTGVQTHPDLRLLPGWDFYLGRRHTGDPRISGTFNSHGTHVAGTAAAVTNNGTGVAGVHANARIVPINVFNALGEAYDIDIAKAIRWAAGEEVAGADVNTYPARVINLSLGGFDPTCPVVLEQAIAAAIQRGASVVVAAGNENANAEHYSPANCPGVITVGATGSNGHRTPYSNFGRNLDIMAPGGTANTLSQGVLSTDWDYLQNQPTYSALNGTSMATPHVSGLLALLRSIRPDLTRTQVEAIMLDSAASMTAAQCPSPRNFFCGVGMLDAAAAIQRANMASEVVPVTYVLAWYCANATCNSWDHTYSRWTALTTGATEGTYSLGSLRNGVYDVWAFRDLDGSGSWSPDEPFGLHPVLLSVSNEVQDNINIVVPRYSTASSLHGRGSADVMDLGVRQNYWVDPGH